MDDQIKSLYWNIYDQVLSNGTFFIEIYPMDIKSDAYITLKKFTTDLWVPERITVDSFKYKNERTWHIVHENLPK